MVKRGLFRPTDILIPSDCDMTLWSTVACDQYTSAPSYWDHVAEMTAKVPSTFHLMLPEAYLELRDAQDESNRITAAMKAYLDTGIFRTLEKSYIYVERTLPTGSCRHGLIGALDLDYYDYGEDAVTPIRATEHTVESRLPARVALRRNALLEMPHIMVFIDDPEDSVMQCARIGADEILYDFDLMCGGGHLMGKQVSEINAGLVSAMLDELTSDDCLQKKYGRSDGGIVYAIGDGNHSLAAAKKCWEEVREHLTPEEQAVHPARFALVELVNIHDEGVEFHPIHRTVFDICPETFLHEAKRELLGPEGAEVTLICGGATVSERVPSESAGQAIERVDAFCQSFAQRHGGRVDYIHGREEAVAFGCRPDAASILLPRLEKQELFTSVMTTGVFCKKSFSIGEASEKRYYLECRKIR